MNFLRLGSYSAIHHSSVNTQLIFNVEYKLTILLTYFIVFTLNISRLNIVFIFIEYFDLKSFVHL